MASNLKTASNQRNSKNSTGPRPEKGKAISALNALKQRLSSGPLLDSGTQEIIDKFSESSIGDAKHDQQSVAFVLEVAEAQVMVLRVGEARRRAWAEAKQHPSIKIRESFLALPIKM